MEHPGRGGDADGESSQGVTKGICFGSQPSHDCKSSYL